MRRHSESSEQKRHGRNFRQELQGQNSNNGNKKIKKSTNPYSHIVKKQFKNTQQYRRGRIRFKWQPYQIQLNYMNHVLNTLDNRMNGLVQAPTGSGKTLCLLNSVFGWLSNLDSESKELKYPRKVIYMSRAHSQLEQIKKQLEKTQYRPNMVVFGGRKKMCCNEKVCNPDIEDSAITQRCHQAVKNRNAHLANLQAEKQQKEKGVSLSQLMKSQEQVKLEYEEKKKIQQLSCPYFVKFKERNNYLPVFNKLAGSAITINDEYDACLQNKRQICPYYYPSTAKYKADLIVMPYNYLLNPNILPRNSSVISGSIIIFDEGHNITECAREGLTITLTQTFFANVAKELKSCLNKLKKKFKQKHRASDQLNGSEEEELDQAKQDKPKIVLELDQSKIEGKINSLLSEVNSLASCFKKYEQENMESVQKKPTDTHYGHHKNKKGKGQNETLIQRGHKGENIIKTVMKILFDKQMDLHSPKSQFPSYIQKLKLISKTAEQIFGAISSLSKQMYRPFPLHRFSDTLTQICQILTSQELLFDYGLIFQWRKVKDQQHHFLQAKLYCFNPKLMFDKIQKCSPMSIIVTSGTLSPMETWQVQTGLIFNILSNNKDHVISPKQCRTIFIPSYERKPAYYSTGDEGKSVPYNCKRSLEAIQKICKKTPGGVLVILPSTAWITEMKNSIKHSSITKKQFFEEKGNPIYKNLQKFQEIYKEACYSKDGAILFTKCRGLVTQGIDFPDDLCRAVVVVGYPYPNKSKPSLRGKLEYFDRCKAEGKSNIDGQKWLQKQIIRAVNQGIGRVIRHKDDYGMIFLLDERYKWPKIKKDISGWALRNQATITHQEIESQCQKFFHMQTKGGQIKLEKKGPSNDMKLQF